MRRLMAVTVAAIALAAAPLGRTASAQVVERTASAGCDRYRAALEPFTTFVAERMTALRIPGLVVGFFRGPCTWVASLGVADLENQTPMRTTASFRTASVQKSMTAVAILQLAERGRLDLDAEIQRYVDYFPRKPWPITPRGLLSHLAGISHYRDRAAEQHFTTHKTVREAIEVFAGFDLVAQPGTEYRYSSYGYNLLGAAIESASGQSYESYLRAAVWGPAGMADTRMDDPTALIPRRVRGYRLIDGAVKNSEFIDVSSRFAAGGARTTVPDLLRFLQALNAGTLLSKASLTAMYTQARTVDGKPVPYSLGWQILPLRDRGSIVANDGGQPETRTFFLNDPAEDLGLALAMNLEADVYAPIVFRLFELVAGRALVLDR